jgi:hypothetical protein
MVGADTATSVFKPVRQNSRQNHSTKGGDTFFENVTEYKHFGKSLTK